MKIFPAIDLKDGNVVRLTQGDYDRETVYSAEPDKVAADFERMGAKNIHIVDLDGAKDGIPKNLQVIEKIAKRVDMFVQVGGGIRNEDRIKAYLDIGVNRVILGTVAVENPDFLRDMVSKFGEKIAVGVDARNGKVSVRGWLEDTDLDSFQFCKNLSEVGVKTIIYTDIEKDGGLGGTNIEAYERLSELLGVDIIASGGVSHLWELEKLSGIVEGAIVGKAIYDGRLELSDCLNLEK